MYGNVPVKKKKLGMVGTCVEMSEMSRVASSISIDAKSGIQHELTHGDPPTRSGSQNGSSHVKLLKGIKKSKNMHTGTW